RPRIHAATTGHVGTLFPTRQRRRLLSQAARARVETPRSVLENIGRRIIEIRIARGWTQETCAEKLWVDVRLLRRIEGGRHNLTVSTLVRLAQRLEVPTSALFDASQLEDARRPGRR